MYQENEFWEDLVSGRFALMVKDSARGEKLCNSQAVYNVMKPLFAEQEDVEVVYGIFLDAKNRVISIEKLFSGTISGSSVYPREIVKKILSIKATSLVLVHNHPSGEPEPSRNDFAVTMQVGIALESIGAAILDHVIVGGGLHSMADSGWLKQATEKISALSNP